MVAGFSVPAGVQAQTVTPGQVTDTLKPPIELQPAQPAPGVSTPRPQARPSGAGGATITVQRFEFEGNTQFDDARLAALLTGYLNQPVNLLDLYDAADHVAQFYADHGYALASVNVPPQKVSGGTILLQVAEGRVGDISVVNGRWYQPDHIKSYLGSFSSGEPYRSEPLQEALRVINTLPGLTAKATVRPGGEDGTSDVQIDVAERHFEGGLSLDNYGRESIGEFRSTGYLVVNNPTRVADQLKVVGLISEDSLLKYGHVDYSVPLNHAGTRVRLGYSHAEFSVDDSPVDGKSRYGEVMLDHPLLADGRQQLTGSIGVSRSLSNADFSGIVFSQTSITLLETALAYSRTHDSGAVTQVSTALSSNFQKQEIADFANGDVDGKQRIKWELDLQHLMRLTTAFQLYLRLNGVYSPDPLSDPEKYSLGGPYSIRAFPASEIRGDSGFFETVELRHRRNLGSATLVTRLFVDGGRVYAVDAPDPDSLSDIGIGGDLIWQPLRLKLDWAYPLNDRNVSDGRDSGRVFGSVAVTF